MVAESDEGDSEERIEYLREEIAEITVRIEELKHWGVIVYDAGKT